MDCYCTRKADTKKRQFRNVSIGGNFSGNGLDAGYGEHHHQWTFSAAEVQALSEEEINAFFTALYVDAKHYMYQVLFSVMLATGCRIGEICALTWDNIDFDANRIHICRHFVCSKSGSQIMDGCKTNAGDRWLTLDDGIMEMLREYRAYYLEKAESYGSKWNNGENALFYAEKRYGGCINPDTVRAFLTRFTKKHGLQKIHPHMFRHTSVSLQLQAGISIANTAKRAGHARPDR